LDDELARRNHLAQLEQQLLDADEHAHGAEHVEPDEQGRDLLEVLHVAEDTLGRHHRDRDRRDGEDAVRRTRAYQPDHEHERERDEHVDRCAVLQRHGEQLTERLADASVLHLNTDTAVDVRYERAGRHIEIERGQVVFEVAHDATRPFRVRTGTAEVVDVGTKFDVYRQPGSTLVTVLEGRVTVAAITPGANANQGLVLVGAGEQVRVAEGAMPSSPAKVDAQRATAWLRRQIAFEHEPLALVAAEFNRYASKPIEIETPALGALTVSGVFAADDTESFIAFLRSLDGVRVEVTATRIRVFKT